MTVPAPARIISYPARSPATAQFGYNLGGTLDDAHVALAAAGGATMLRTQFGWETVEDYATGNLSLQTSWRTLLASCASRGMKLCVTAAYGPPRTTVGTLTVTGTVASGSPAGASIPVAPYAFTIQPGSTDFAGGLFFGGALTAFSAYYGDPIVTATSNSITLGAALATTLTPGMTINVQRLRYQPPLSDTDPSIAAYVRYVSFIAQQIAAAGCQGWVDAWNEFVWAHDRWSHPQDFYDVAPGSITTSNRMKAFLQQLQAISLPAGVKLINGVSDKSGSNAIAAQSIPGANITYDSLHNYGNNPEQSSWSYYGYGATAGKFSNPSGNLSGVSWPASSNDRGFDAVIASDQGGNFRGMEMASALTPGGPWPNGRVMSTEAGLLIADDTQQARWNVRRVLSNWGNRAPTLIYVLDDNNAPGSTTYSVAPQSTPRAAYTALQRIAAVIGRMGATQLARAVPDVIGWNTDGWPLMCVRVKSSVPGHSVMFVWQRTWADTAWTAIPSPPPQPAHVFVPSGLTVAECFDTITGGTITPTGPTSNTLTVPVTDNPVAVRFSP